MLKKTIAILLFLIVMGSMSLTAFASVDGFVAKYAAVQAAFGDLSDGLLDPQTFEPSADLLASMTVYVERALDTIVALKDAYNALSPDEIEEINALDPEILPLAAEMIRMDETLQPALSVLQKLSEMAAIFDRLGKTETWADHVLLDSLIAQLDDLYTQLVVSRSECAAAFDLMEMSYDDILADISISIATIKNDLHAAQTVYDKIAQIGTVTLDKEAQITDAYLSLNSLTSDLQVAYITNIDTLEEALDELNGLKKYQTGTKTGSGTTNPRTGITFTVSFALLAFAGSLVLIVRRKNARARNF